MYIHYIHIVDCCCLLYIYMCVFTHTLTHKWLLSFQESFGLSWLPGTHLAHVNTKWTLVDSLMGT